MSRAWGDEKYVQYFGWKSLGGRYYSDTLEVDGRIISGDESSGNRVGCVDWIHLPQDRHRWLSVVTTVKNVRAEGGKFFD
jgi:hypothetical protein